MIRSFHGTASPAQLLASCLAVLLMLMSAALLHAQPDQPSPPGKTTVNETPAPESSGIAQFVEESTWLGITVQAQKIHWRNLFQDAPSLSKKKRAQLAQFSEQIETRLDKLRVIVDQEPVFLTARIHTTADEQPVQLYVHNRPGFPLAEFSELVPMISGRQPILRGDYLVFGDNDRSHSKNGPQSILAAPSSPKHADADLQEKKSEEIQAFDKVAPASRPEFSAAAKLIADFPIQVVVSPPEYVRKTFEELLPDLPEKIGGGPTSLLTDGLQWIAWGIDPAGPSSLLIIQSKSEKSAQALAARLPDLLRQVIGNALKNDQSLPFGADVVLFNLVKPTVQGDQIHIDLTGEQAVSSIGTLIVAMGAKAAAEATETTLKNRFKQLGLGMHNYHDAYGSFPPEQKARDSEGRSGLSWRVHLLPFLDQNKLYQEFHLNEPWDSPHNIKLLEKMPEIFKAAPQDFVDAKPLKSGETTIQAPVGEKTIAGGVKPVMIRNIVDGTSNTVFFVEVKPELAVPWTAPRDYEFDPANPASGLQKREGDKYLFAFADGSIRLVPASLKPKTFLNLFQMNDGNVIENY